MAVARHGRFVQLACDDKGLWIDPSKVVAIGPPDNPLDPSIHRQRPIYTAGGFIFSILDTAENMEKLL